VSIPIVPPDRNQRRSLAVRNWHRRALDGWAKAYDLDCSGEFAGKCARCLLELYVWEDSRDPERATSYTEATARSLGVPGFFIHFEDDGDDNLTWMNSTMIWPQRTEIGGETEFAHYLKRLRDAHRIVYHDPAVLLAEITKAA